MGKQIKCSGNKSQKIIPGIGGFFSLPSLMPGMTYLISGLS